MKKCLFFVFRALERERERDQERDNGTAFDFPERERESKRQRIVRARSKKQHGTERAREARMRRGEMSFCFNIFVQVSKFF